MRTEWSGNVFVYSKPGQQTFTMSDGTQRTVEMWPTELSAYRYGRTDVFEAVILPANRVNFVAILPAPDRSVDDVLQLLQTSRGELDRAMTRTPGVAEMAFIHIRADLHLRSHLEKLGLKRIFKDLGGMVRIDGSHFTEINQSIDLTVDRSGIRADAFTGMGGIYGGVMGGVVKPFHLTLNRPYVFMIRDNITNVLLFIGVVADPMQA